MSDTLSARFEQALLRPCLTCQRRREAAEAAAEAAGAKTAILSVKDRATGRPLPGATYRIVREGRIVTALTSTLGGELILPPLATGIYGLWSTAAPNGFAMETQSHTLTVDTSGAALINGEPTAHVVLYAAAINTALPQTPAVDLPTPDVPDTDSSCTPPTSATPVVLPVGTGDSVIAGSGEDGSDIAVRLPNGQELKAKVAGTQWAAYMPNTVHLAPGDRIDITQTSPGKLESRAVTVKFTV